MVKETEPDGGVTSSTLRRRGQPADHQDGRLHRRPEQPQRAAPTGARSKAYDPAGRLASETDAMGWSTAVHLHRQRACGKVICTDGAEHLRVEENTYDTAGNLIKRSPTTGRPRRPSPYDAGGRQLTSTSTRPGSSGPRPTPTPPTTRAHQHRDRRRHPVTQHRDTLRRGGQGRRDRLPARARPVGRWKLAETGGHRLGRQLATTWCRRQRHLVTDPGRLRGFRRHDSYGEHAGPVDRHRPQLHRRRPGSTRPRATPQPRRGVAGRRARERLRR